MAAPSVVGPIRFLTPTPTIGPLFDELDGALLPKGEKEQAERFNTREQAAKEMEAFTGQRWTQSPEGCVIM